MNKNIPDCISDLKNEIAKFGLKSHSGQVGPGDIFVALPSGKAPEFIAQAAAGGAAAIVADAGQIEKFKAANPDKSPGIRSAPFPARTSMPEMLWRFWQRKNSKPPICLFQL
jgi:UDP-N-acetylmuramyl tripeptide synthase